MTPGDESTSEDGSTSEDDSTLEGALSSGVDSTLDGDSDSERDPTSSDKLVDADPVIPLPPSDAKTEVNASITVSKSCVVASRFRGVVVLFGERRQSWFLFGPAKNC